MYESIVCFAFHLVHFRISRSASFVPTAVFASSHDCVSALYFYHSKAFYYDCSLRGADCPESTVDFARVSVWSNGTWLLCFWPLYLWGQGVYLMRDGDVFWGQEGICSEEWQQSTIKEQGEKTEIWCQLIIGCSVKNAYTARIFCVVL